MIGGTHKNLNFYKAKYVTSFYKHVGLDLIKTPIRIVNNRKEFYNVLKESLENFETQVNFKIPNYNEKDYDLSIIDEILLQHPDIDYGFKSWEYTLYENPNYSKRILKVNLKYELDKKTMEKEKKDVKNKVNYILKSIIKPDMSDIEKELAIHDYIIKLGNYDVKAKNAKKYVPEDFNAYGILINKTGVCESYAKATYHLLNNAGIQCKYITGKAAGEDHSWNMVKIDNKWYNLDVTWDDPVLEDVPKVYEEIDEVVYDYFNLPDSIFNKDHKRGEFESTHKELYPVCDSKKYSFENIDFSSLKYAKIVE
nr:transglutaminase domain-containing protein [Clostridium botulinum]